MDLGGNLGQYQKEVRSKEKTEQRERTSKFCANDWNTVVVLYLLQTLGHGVNQLFSSRKKLSMFSYENITHE